MRLVRLIIPFLFIYCSAGAQIETIIWDGDDGVSFDFVNDTLLVYFVSKGSAGLVLNDYFPGNPIAVGNEYEMINSRTQVRHIKLLVLMCKRIPDISSFQDLAQAVQQFNREFFRRIGVYDEIKHSFVWIRKYTVAECPDFRCIRMHY